MLFIASLFMQAIGKEWENIINFNFMINQKRSWTRKSLTAIAILAQSLVFPIGISQV
jgi:hypothetical protein